MMNRVFLGVLKYLGLNEWAPTFIGVLWGERSEKPCFLYQRMDPKSPTSSYYVKTTRFFTSSTPLLLGFLE
jgi:hypothetical protein